MKVNGNMNIFKICAQNLETKDYFMQDAIRFETHDDFIYSVNYDDWDNAIYKIPIYKSTSKEDLRKTLITISKFYTENPNGVLTIIEEVLYV